MFCVVFSKGVVRGVCIYRKKSEQLAFKVLKCAYGRQLAIHDVAGRSYMTYLKA